MAVARLGSPGHVSLAFFRCQDAGEADVGRGVDVIRNHLLLPLKGVAQARYWAHSFTHKWKEITAELGFLIALHVEGCKDMDGC